MTNLMYEPAEVVVPSEAIAARIQVLAQEIVRCYEALEERVVIVPVMTGAFVFAADLVRHMPGRLRIDVISVRSYGSGTISNGPKIEGFVREVADRHVLLVDDILDSGRTLSFLRKDMSERGAASVRTCVLLRKRIPPAMSTPCEFVGFDIPDLFVAGYGLDYDGWFRNLPDVVSLRKVGESAAMVR
jgi:hypoxanthine phosphoribosyltransferase